MSRALRHDPGRVGLVLDRAGWAPVAHVLKALRMSQEEFDIVVAQNDKRRFAVETRDDGQPWVRASQGHTVSIDLQLDPLEPPEFLYHGTSRRAIPSILATGLNRGRRHHVHLSSDVATAYRVGARRGGQVAILTVSAARMARDGNPFYRSANGVWLTDNVPAAYLAFPSATGPLGS